MLSVLRLAKLRGDAAEVQELLDMERVLASGALPDEAWAGRADAGRTEAGWAGGPSWAEGKAGGGGGVLRGLRPLSKPLTHDAEENANLSIR